MADAIVIQRGEQMRGASVDRCPGEDCEDYERPIVILAQGVSYHYDGDRERAHEEAWRQEHEH